MSGTNNTPAPPQNADAHADDREPGDGAADARPDIGDSEAGPGDLASPSGEVAGAMKSGGQSGGKDYAAAPTPANDDGDHAGQSVQGYSGGDNPNATSTRQATHDRSS